MIASSTDDGVTGWGEIDQVPEWAYGGIVYTKPAEPADPPTITAIADRLTVLRGGKLIVGAARPSDLDDDQLKAVADTGGTIGVMYHAGFLGLDRKNVTIDTVVDHLAHIVKTVGEEIGRAHV